MRGAAVGYSTTGSPRRLLGAAQLGVLADRQLLPTGAPGYAENSDHRGREASPGEAVLPSKDATLHSGTAYSLACVAVALNHLAGVIRVLTGMESIALLVRS